MGLFRKNHTKRWDGYQQEPVVLIDDVDLTHRFLAPYLKIWAERFPFTAELKGSSARIRPRHIIMTSNYETKAIWPDYETLLTAIRRRFDEHVVRLRTDLAAVVLPTVFFETNVKDEVVSISSSGEDEWEAVGQEQEKDREEDGTCGLAPGPSHSAEDNTCVVFLRQKQRFFAAEDDPFALRPDDLFDDDEEKDEEDKEDRCEALHTYTDDQVQNSDDVIPRVSPSDGLVWTTPPSAPPVGCCVNDDDDGLVAEATAAAAPRAEDSDRQKDDGQHMRYDCNDEMKKRRLKLNLKRKVY